MTSSPTPPPPIPAPGSAEAVTSVLGIDIGGSGVKAAPVDIHTGELLAKRLRVETPQPSTPEALTEVVVELRDQIGWRGPVGVTFPGVVRNGVIHTTANVDAAWRGVDGAARLGAALGDPVTMVNDADAAGLAEVAFGAGRHEPGTVLIVTLGTGIGTALFTGGTLVPNTELGHLMVRGRDAERRASAKARTDRKMSWRRWAKHVRRYLRELERLLWPDLFVLGGGVSKQFDRYGHRLRLDTPVVPAEMHNDAGIVGAALACRRADPDLARRTEAAQRPDTAPTPEGAAPPEGVQRPDTGPPPEAAQRPDTPSH